MFSVLDFQLRSFLKISPSSFISSTVNEHHRLSREDVAKIEQDEKEVGWFRSFPNNSGPLGEISEIKMSKI